jgi:hypothetical protein
MSTIARIQRRSAAGRDNRRRDATSSIGSPSTSRRTRIFRRAAGRLCNAAKVRACASSSSTRREVGRATAFTARKSVFRSPKHKGRQDYAFCIDRCPCILRNYFLERARLTSCSPICSQSSASSGVMAERRSATRLAPDGLGSPFPSISHVNETPKAAA